MAEYLNALRASYHNHTKITTNYRTTFFSPWELPEV